MLLNTCLAAQGDSEVRRVALCEKRARQEVIQQPFAGPDPMPVRKMCRSFATYT